MTWLAFVSINTYGQSGQAQTTPAEDILTIEEKKWIADREIFRVAHSENWAPMTFLSDGKPAGYSVDYLNLVANKVGIKLDYISNNGELNIILGLMRSGEADLIHGISMTPDREVYLDFTDEYLILPMVYFGLSGSEPIKSLTDFDGKKVGIIDRVSTTEVYLSRYPDIDFTLFDTVDMGIADLSNGSIDVLIHTLPIVNHAIAKNFISGIDNIGVDFLLAPEERDYLHLATQKGDSKLLSILKKGMAAITEQEYTDLSNRWLIENQKINDIGLTKEEIEWLSQNRIIKTATSLTFSPLEYIDENGEHNGISRSFLDEIAKRLDVEFVWSENKSWDEGIEKIKSGEADILPSVTTTKERESFLIFTDVYMNFSNVIYTRVDDQHFTTMEDLSGFSVAQAKGTAVIDFIHENYPDVKVIEVENTYDALKLLSTGQVDAYIGDIPSVTDFIAKLGYSNITITGTTTHTSNDAIGIRSDLPLLASAMQKALADISSQRKNEILKSWISTGNEIEPDYSLVWNVLIAATASIILILLWLNKLRLEINRRKKTEKALLNSQNEAQKAQAEAERARDEKILSLEELRASEIRQKTLLELAPQAVIIFDAELNILYFNGNAQKTFGYKGSEVRGKHLNILLPDTTHDAHAHHVENFEKTNKTSLSMDQCSDIKAKRKNGELFPATASVAKIMLEGENVYIVMLRDVTERVKANKLLIESEDRLSRAQKIAHIGNWEWNIVTGELMWSTEIYNIFGLEKREFDATYDAFLERIHPDDREDLELAVADALDKGAHYYITHRIICPDGTEKIVREIGEILRDEDGKPLRMDGTVQDITESWRNEQDLIKSKTKAEQANAAKTQFLAVMSHELRTPLNAIIGFSSLIKDELHGELGNEKYKEYAHDINMSGEHLLTLIDDILDTSRIELDTC